MKSNFVRTYLRLLKKNAFVSTLNHLCVIAGFSSFLLIMNYVIYENSFDTFHPNSSNTYRCVLNQYVGNEVTEKWAISPFLLGETLKKEFPEVIDFTRFRSPLEVGGENVVKYQEKKFRYEKGAKICFTEPSFFRLFSVKFIKGSDKLFSRPNSVIITESVAKTFFGDEEPVDKVIEFKNKIKSFSCNVIGVIEDLPHNTHLPFEIFAPFSLYDNEEEKNFQMDWGRHGYYTYVQLRPNVSPQEFEAKYKKVVFKHQPEFIRDNFVLRYPLQPLTSIHFDTDYSFDLSGAGSASNVAYVKIIAFITLAVAIICYLSSSSAGLIKRAKALNIVKIHGARYRDLVRDLFFENIIFFFSTFLVSILIAFALQPIVADITGVDFNFSINYNMSAWGIMLMAIIFIISLSSLAPSIFLVSIIKPMVVLKGNARFGNSKIGKAMQAALLVTQLSMTMLLTISILTVVKQLDYMINRDTGFEKKNIMVLQKPIITSNENEKVIPFINELKSHSAVVDVISSSDVPGIEIWDKAGFKVAGTNNKEKVIPFMQIDDKFVEFFNLKLPHGRSFSLNFNDSASVILNKAAANALGISSENPLMQKVDKYGQLFTVVGVIDNYNQYSLKKNYEPIAFLYDKTDGGTVRYFSVKLSGNDLRESVGNVKVIWDKYFPDNPIEYFFLEDEFNLQYTSERSLIKITFILLIAMILITCTSIVGFSFNHVLQKTKEIGIKKALAAENSSILKDLLTPYTKLMLIAAIITCPTTYLVIQNWLSAYAFRIDMPYLLFVVSFFAVLFIMLITVSYHVLQSVRQSPIKALRSE